MKKSCPKTVLIFVAILVLLGVLSVAAILLLLKKSAVQGSLTADIYQDGELYTSIPLDQVTESYTFTVTNLAGNTNTIEVRPGEIGVISADCPDKICVKQGFIHNTLLPVTCLPNRLVIRLHNTTESKQVPDIITH